jgi:hypothetical protein
MPYEFQYRKIRPSTEQARLKREAMDRYRRDVARHTAMKALGVEPSGYFNYYNCDRCQREWAEEMSRCDQDVYCFKCSAQLTPYDYQEIYPEEDQPQTNETETDNGCKNDDGHG